MTNIVDISVKSSASSFLSSLGIVTHSNFDNSVYENANLVIRSLDYLGINLVRDGLATTGTPAEVVDALAKSGINFNFVTSSALPTLGSEGLADYVEALADFRTKYGDALTMIEGLNEVNIQSFGLSGDWAVNAAAFQKSLYEAVKANSVLSDIGVLNLSIGMESTSDYARIGDLAAYSDYANVHAYQANYAAIDQSMEASIALASTAATGQTMIVSETGYNTYLADKGLGVTEATQARLTLTTLLNSWENGAAKTFLYELLDEPEASFPGNEREGHFGLFNMDGTPKLAATAVHNLTTILDYGATTTAQAASSFSVDNSAAKDAHVTALGKGGGVYDLLIWRDAQVWNPTTRQEIKPADAQITINLGKTEGTVYVYDPLKGTAPIAVYHNIRTLVLPVGGDPLIVEVGAASAVKELAPAPLTGKLTMSADDFVANINSLAKSVGDATITLTGGNVLHVASNATMNDIIANYGGLLSKVSGEVSFLIKTTGPDWVKEDAYSARGVSLYSEAENFKDGVITHDAIFYANGSRFESAYTGGKLAYSVATAVDGSTVTTHYDLVSGLVTTRYSAPTDGSTTAQSYENGKLSQLVQTMADGSRVTTSYNASGAITSVQSVDAKNNWTTELFDPASGAVTSVSKAFADKSQEIWSYAITGQPYTSEHKTISASGAVTLDERFTATGTLVYRSTLSADGSSLTRAYDANGRLTEEISKAANGDVLRTALTYNAAGGLASKQVVDAAGAWTTTTYDAGGATTSVIKALADTSQEIWSYAITGQPYTSEHKTISASGTVTLDERFTAAGTLVYRSTASADGSSLTRVYDASARLTEEISKAANGDVLRTALTYNAAGGLASKQVVDAAGTWTTTTYDAGGTTKSVIKAFADKSTDVWNYGITGQAYATEHQVANARGQVTLVERYASDNSVVFSSVVDESGKASTTIYANDSKRIIYYDLAGHETEERTTNKDGSFSAITFAYDSAGKLSVRQTYDSAGNWTTASYDPAGTLKTLSKAYPDKSSEYWTYGITGQNYTWQYQTVNAQGVATLMQQFSADNVLLYQSKLNTDGSILNLVLDRAGRETESRLVKADGTFATTVTVYDAAGHVTVRQLSDSAGNWTTATYDAAGALKTLSKAFPDKSAEYWTYGITGKDYTQQRQTINASGVATMLEQFTASNVMIYRASLNADGSTQFNSYDNNGRIKQEYLAATDGSWKNGTFTFSAVGSLVGKQINDSAGNWTTLTYTAGGGVATVNKAYADRTSEVWDYGVTGQPYTTQYQKFDASGAVTLVERFTADKKLVSAIQINVDGSSTYASFDTAGALLNETVVTLDGKSTATRLNGIEQLAASSFGAAHDLLDMTKLNSGYQATIALTNTLQPVTWDTYSLLAAGSSTLLTA